MIVSVSNNDVLSPYTFQKHVAFAVNMEGINNSKFCHRIGDYALGCIDTGKKELGDIATKKTGNTRYYGIVCYSLKKGWVNWIIRTKLTPSRPEIH